MQRVTELEIVGSRLAAEEAELTALVRAAAAPPVAADNPVAAAPAEASPPRPPADTTMA